MMEILARHYFAAYACIDKNVGLKLNFLTAEASVRLRARCQREVLEAMSGEAVRKQIFGCSSEALQMEPPQKDFRLQLEHTLVSPL